MDLSTGEIPDQPRVDRAEGEASGFSVGTGAGNVVVLSGATTPLGEIVIRPESVDVVIDGVSGGEPWSDGTLWSDGTSKGMPVCG